jgi:hypothetical protein
MCRRIALWKSINVSKRSVSSLFHPDYIFWDVALRNMVSGYQLFEGICHLVFYFEEGGSKFFRNVVSFLPNYTVSYLRRR